MTNQEIIDIAKKHMEHSVMHGFVGTPSAASVLAFARELLGVTVATNRREGAPVAAQEPTCKYCQDSGEVMMGDCTIQPCEFCQPAQGERQPDDAARLDHLEQWRLQCAKSGAQWHGFSFDMDRPIRQQLDESIAADNRA